MSDMLIISGSLFLAAADRAAYLEAVAEVTLAARQAPGCLDFVQAPDPLDPTRIVILERWESAELLEAYRASGDDDEPMVAPDITGAEVHRYSIGEISAP